MGVSFPCRYPKRSGPDCQKSCATSLTGTANPAVLTSVHLRVTETLHAVELDVGHVLQITLADGSTSTLELRHTDAAISFSTLPEPGVEFAQARTFYQFSCVLRINGQDHHLEREVPTWRSFYEPWVIDGLRIWFDATADIFTFLRETHGRCAPTRQARFALQDATLRICPDPLHPWCPLRPRGLSIQDCYNGEDCWLGPYFGVSAHGGLDINHRRGTPIWAPIAFDRQFLFNSLAAGHENNRWRGLRRWPDGAEWVLQCHHLSALTVPENTPLAAGQHYAHGAGVHCGSHDHSHFVFAVRRDGKETLLDPWILFWQMYQDRAAGLVTWGPDAIRTACGYLPSLSG